jgi:aminopeptidase N
LGRFEEDWIKKAGCNSVLARWDKGDKSGNAKLTLVQGWTLEEHQTLRYHKMRVGFYAEDGGLLDVKDVILQNRAETVLEYDGSMGVAAVVPNYDDLAFIKILMDDTTCEWMKSNMARLPEELTRSIVLRSLFEMVKDARGIKSHEFVELCLESYPKETSVAVALNIEVVQRAVLSAYVLPEHKDGLRQKAFDVAYSMLAMTTDQDRRSSLTDMLRANTKSAASLDVMKNWYEGTDAILKGLEPTMDQKYGIIKDLMGSGKYPAELTTKMLAIVEAEDTTDTKKRNETTRKWMMATEAERSEAWTLMISKESPWSYSAARDVINGMMSEWVPYEQREKLYNRYFDDLSVVLNERSREFAKQYHKYAKAEYNDYQVFADKHKAVMQDIDSFDNFWKKELKEEADLTEKILVAMKFAASG